MFTQSFTILTLIILNLVSVHCGVVAVTNLHKCINTGTDPAITCDQKLIVTLTIENNKIYQTDLLNFEVACINSPTGQCPCPCYYLDDPICTCRDLAKPISIGLTKTPVYAVYSLSQPKTVNGRPYEEYIKTGPGGAVGSCSDSQYDVTPTCGWAKMPDANGVLREIRDSQGFCCKCPSLGGDGYITRGYRSCSWSPTWLLGEPAGSAHCLRYDEYWWYRAYTVGLYQLDFDIQVHINTSALISPTPNNTSSSTFTSEEESLLETLTVNPSKTFVMSKNKTLSVKLLGDLQSYRQIQVLDGHQLMIPLQPGLDPNQVFTSNLDMWVIVPPNMVTTTGECNKIGIDYSGFRYQSERCDRSIGTCLNNQLYHLEIQDLDRISKGLEPLYNITRYGGGTQNTRQVTSVSNGGGLALRLPLKGIKTSLVTLELKADNVTLVMNRAPGKILSSEVCTFDGVMCGGFQAISTRGFLRLVVQNTGAVTAEFRAGVDQCSGGVLPIEEEIAAIPAGGSHNFTFELFMETDQAANRSCTVVVTDSEGGIADSSMVYFYTNATEYVPPPDQSDLGDDPSDPGGPPTFSTCAKKCPNLFNFKCALFNGCIMRLINGLMTAALLVALVTVLWVALQRGWINRLLRCCCKCSKSKRPQQQHHNSINEVSGPNTPTIMSNGAQQASHDDDPGREFSPALAQSMKEFEAYKQRWLAEHENEQNFALKQQKFTPASSLLEDTKQKQEQQYEDTKSREMEQQWSFISAYREPKYRYYQPPKPESPPSPGIVPGNSTKPDRIDDSRTGIGSLRDFYQQKSQTSSPAVPPVVYQGSKTYKNGNGESFITDEGIDFGNERGRAELELTTISTEENSAGDIGGAMSAPTPDVASVEESFEIKTSAVGSTSGPRAKKLMRQNARKETTPTTTRNIIYDSRPNQEQQYEERERIKEHQGQYRMYYNAAAALEDDDGIDNDAFSKKDNEHQLEANSQQPSASHSDSQHNGMAFIVYDNPLESSLSEASSIESESTEEIRPTAPPMKSPTLHKKPEQH